MVIVCAKTRVMTDCATRHRTQLPAVLLVQFFTSTTDQKDSHKVETESDKTRRGGKSRNLFDIRHHLGNTIENPQTREYQSDSPDNLKLIDLFVDHNAT